MDPSLLYIVLFLLVLSSAFFSSSETAFSSVNLIRLKQYVEDERKGAALPLKLSDQFDEILLVALVLNNVSNFAAAGLATYLAVYQFGDFGVFMTTIALTTFMIIFAELLPKSLAKTHAEKIVMRIAKIYQILMWIMYPLILAMQGFKKIFSKPESEKEEEPSVTEDELEVIIDTMKEEGVLEEDEVDMLQGILDLSDTFVKNIMTPRADVVSIDVAAEVKAIKDVFLEHRYSRIPVFKDAHDNIIGILYERDLYREMMEREEDIDIKALMRDPIYVSNSMRVSGLLAKLKIEKQHMAVVIDEYGAAAGVVTMEDVFEEVVGEIYDEDDDEEEVLIKESDGVYEVNADYSLNDICDLYDVQIKVEDDGMPVGNWLYEKLEDIPEVGNAYVESSLVFTVVEVEDRRIKRIRVALEEKNEEEN